MTDQPTPRAPEENERLREQVRNALRKERELDAALAAFGDRLAKIAEWHRLNVDEHGGNTGICSECGYAWPCPTYQWATDDMAEPNCTWDLSECEIHNHAAPKPTASDDRDLDACGRWCGERARHHHTRDEEGTVWTLPGPKPTAPDDLQREIESAIRPRTGCWPSTVEIVAAAVMDVLRQRGVAPARPVRPPRPPTPPPGGMQG